MELEDNIRKNNININKMQGNDATHYSHYTKMTGNGNGMQQERKKECRRNAAAGAKPEMANLGNCNKQVPMSAKFPPHLPKN